MGCSAAMAKPSNLMANNVVRCEPAAILVGIADEVEAEGWFPLTC